MFTRFLIMSGISFCYLTKNKYMTSMLYFSYHQNNCITISLIYEKWCILSVPNKKCITCRKTWQSCWRYWAYALLGDPASERCIWSGHTRCCQDTEASPGTARPQHTPVTTCLWPHRMVSLKINKITFYDNFLVSTENIFRTMLLHKKI